MASRTLSSMSGANESIPLTIPTDHISQRAYHYAKKHLHPLVLQHSIRVYLYAKTLAKTDISYLPAIQTTVPGVPDLFSATAAPPSRHLFLASIFHDIGTCSVHDHAQRFEVCGADAAIAFICSIDPPEAREVPVSDLREIWTAISLHTSPGLAERMSPITRLLRMAVKADFGAVQYRDLLEPENIEAIEAEFPRGEIEKVLGDCVAMQAEARHGPDRATKAPEVSWPCNLLRARLEEPEWQGVNKGF